MINLTREQREELHDIMSTCLNTFQRLDGKWYVGGKDELIDALNESNFLTKGNNEF